MVKKKSIVQCQVSYTKKVYWLINTLTFICTWLKVHSQCAKCKQLQNRCTFVILDYGEHSAHSTCHKYSHPCILFLVFQWGSGGSNNECSGLLIAPAPPSYHLMLYHRCPCALTTTSKAGIRKEFHCTVCAATVTASTYSTYQNWNKPNCNYMHKKLAQWLLMKTDISLAHFVISLVNDPEFIPLFCSFIKFISQSIVVFQYAKSVTVH